MLEIIAPIALAPLRPGAGSGGRAPLALLASQLNATLRAHQLMIIMIHDDDRLQMICIDVVCIAAAAACLKWSIGCAMCRDLYTLYTLTLQL